MAQKANFSKRIAITLSGSTRVPFSLSKKKVPIPLKELDHKRFIICALRIVTAATAPRSRAKKIVDVLKTTKERFGNCEGGVGLARKLHYLIAICFLLCAAFILQPGERGFRSRFAEPPPPPPPPPFVMRQAKTKCPAKYARNSSAAAHNLSTAWRRSEGPQITSRQADRFQRSLT